VNLDQWEIAQREHEERINQLEGLLAVLERRVEKLEERDASRK